MGMSYSLGKIYIVVSIGIYYSLLIIIWDIVKFLPILSLVVMGLRVFGIGLKIILGVVLMMGYLVWHIGTMLYLVP